MSAAVGNAKNSFIVLDLPRPWLAHLFQHVASGPGGLARAAALSQTCSSLHALSESSAVSYRNIDVPPLIKSSDHPVWQWLAKRQGRVSGMKLEVEVDPGLRGTIRGNESRPDWTQPLQTLSTISDLHLTVYCAGSIYHRANPFMQEWLKPHGYFIEALRAEIDVNPEDLSLSDFCAAAAPCRFVRLIASHHSQDTLNLSELAPVLGSLVQLDIKGGLMWRGKVENIDVLASMSQLQHLYLPRLDLTAAEPWGALASLSSLEVLVLEVAAYGDPSVLSKLTGLSFLELGSYDCGEDVDAVPSSFSSLQPLSTLQQLNTLCLYYKACGATSLQGLAGLSRLQRLWLSMAHNLVSLEGISRAVTELCIRHAERFQDLTGIDGLMGLELLLLFDCGVASLQPLAGLCSLESLHIYQCPLTSLEGLEGRFLKSLKLEFCDSLRQLSGFEKLSALHELVIDKCGVTSLQPLAELRGAKVKLSIEKCHKVKEEVLELPHIQATADVKMWWVGKLKEVVLAGGVRRFVDDRGWGATALLELPQ